MKPLKRLVAAGLVVVVFTFSLFLLRSSTSSAPDFERKSSVLGLEEIVVEIPAGASGSSIARILFEAGVIKSSQAYFRIAVADSRSEKVAPGRHRLTLEISAKQALEQLLDPNRIPNLIKVNEGSWKSEIVDALIRYGYSKQEVTQALTNLQLPEGFSDSEGMLFPAQYSFANGTSALTALQSMIDRFTKDPIAGSILKGSNLFKGQQLLTIASIIQAEGDSQDFEKVSRVIYNRLAIDMPLQMDSTVHYVKKVRGEIFLLSLIHI